MPEYEYAIARGWDVLNPTNIEDIITEPPTINPDQAVPFGSNTRETLDGRRRTHGAKYVRWYWGTMSPADFLALVTFIWGDFHTEDIESTVITRERDESFGKYNAISYLPKMGEDYQRAQDGYIFDLYITHRLILAGGAFTEGFSIGFRI